MKRLLVVAVLVLFLIVFCGAPPEGQGPETTPFTGSAEEVAYQKLTEAEVLTFIKVAPIVRAEIKKSGKKFEGGDSPAGIGEALGQVYTWNKEIAGLDAKLKVAGTTWEKFWPSFAKTWMAMIAVLVSDQISEIEKGLADIDDKLKDPKISEMEKDMMKGMKDGMQEGFKELKKINEKVPQANKDLVKKHWDTLTEIMEIED